jgi:hypothetical protein
LKIKRQKKEITKPDRMRSGMMQEHNTQRVSKNQKAREEMDRQNHMPATPENLPLLPKMPPMFPGLELAAIPPGEVTPMMIVMMIMLGGVVSQWRDACMMVQSRASPEREK